VSDADNSHRKRLGAHIHVYAWSLNVESNRVCIRYPHKYSISDHEIERMRVLGIKHRETQLSSARAVDDGVFLSQQHFQRLDIAMG